MLRLILLILYCIDGNHFIIALDVTNSTNDYNQFISLYEQVNENVGGLPSDCEVLLDNGYSSSDNIKYAEDNNIDAYIQSRQMATLTNNKNPIERFFLINFYWDETKQGFYCPKKELLTHQGITPTTKKDIYYTTKCTQCPYKNECVPKGQYRRIYTKFTEEQKRMMEKMTEESSIQTYGARMGMVEHTFGHDKHNLKIR
jgi:hypothetical protein